MNELGCLHPLVLIELVSVASGVENGQRNDWCVTVVVTPVSNSSRNCEDIASPEAVDLLVVVSKPLALRAFLSLLL